MILTYTTFTCCLYDSKCQKCNSLYKVKHYRDIVWCYKANFKINPSKLKIKKGESCPHLFKCINCKGEHQVITIIQDLLFILILDLLSYVFHSEKTFLIIIISILFFFSTVALCILLLMFIQTTSRLP